MDTRIITQTPGKSATSQIGALLYKQLLLKKHHYFVTAFEIIFPLLIASIPSMIYSGMDNLLSEKRQDFKWINYTTFNPIDPMTEYSFVNTEKLEFVYAPSNDVTNKFMRDSIRAFFGNQKTIKEPIKKNSEEELKNYILNETKWDEEKILIGTIFKGFGNTLPVDLNYKIYYTKSINTRKKYILNDPETYNEYKFSFFLQWQTAVGNTFIRQKAAELNRDIYYKIFLQMFPYPEYKSSPTLFSHQLYSEIYIHIGFIFFVVAIVKRIIEERNNGSKELMEMMGMDKFSYWTSHFIHNFTYGFLILLVISVIYKFSNKSTIYSMQTNVMLLFIILLLFMANQILFCMAFSIFFNRVVFAVASLMTLYLLSYPLLMWTIYADPEYGDYFSFSLFHKLCICLFPSGGLITSLLVIHLFEMGNEGVQWRNLTDFQTVPDINILMVIAMMVLSCFFYVVVIWYFDTFWSSGGRKPFYFFLKRSYWFRKQPAIPSEIKLERSANTVDNFEEEPKNAVRTIVIKDMSKVIQQGSYSKCVLQNVSLKCYQGQITVLLGDSGTGKTSMMDIMAGKELSTKGVVFVCGFDVSKEMPRQLLGVCPQHMILHDELSVEQHLKFYAGVKGRLSYGTEQVLNSLRLMNKRNEMVSNLTFSEKRKLSLALAIVGPSMVLILDEPTHGMDSESKRHVWEALLALKDTRTIIVSTPSLEEADVLGDRIAVIAEGEIQSCGTPAFLKRTLGAGYHLHIKKDVNFNLTGLTSLLKMHASAAALEHEAEKEISFHLGTVGELGDLFEELESCKNKLGFISYGVSSSTLRDVLSNLSNKKQNIVSENSGKEDLNRDYLHPVLNPSPILQFRSLFLKNILRSKRCWRFHIVQLTIPFFLMLLCCYCMKVTSLSPYQPLKLDISNVYGATEGFYYNEDTSLSDMADIFENVLKSKDISLEKVSEPTHYILKYGKKDFAKYLKRLIVGGTFDRLPNGYLNLTAWHNSAAFHSMPMSILLMQTTLLRYVANSGSISLTFVPIISVREKYRRVYFNDIGSSGWVEYFLPLAFTFLSLSFALAPTREKTTKAKLLQLMSGVPAVIYWLASFIWDYMFFLFICTFMIVPAAIFFPSTLGGAHSESIGTLLLLFFLYGWASLPLVYIVTILIKRESNGLSIFIMISLLFSVATAALLVDMIPLLFMKSREALSRLDDATWFVLLFPTYSVSSGARATFAIAFHNAACDIFTPKDLAQCNSSSMSSTPTLLQCCKDTCTGDNCHEIYNSLSWKNKLLGGAGPAALFLGLEGAVFFGCLFLLETRILHLIRFHLNRLLDQRVFRKTNRHQILREENIIEDPKVLQEEERIRNLISTQQGSNGEALVVLDLKKGRHVDNRLTFGVRVEEHFTILGVNGSGKTSAFRMLTGDEPSEGNAFIQSYSLKGSSRKFLSCIGYCPEEGPLLDELTGREMLLVFGQLKGLQGRNLQTSVNELIQSLELTNCADQISQLYSASDKRKLSVALAILGSPSVILLDEPTSRADFKSRQQIWKTVTAAQKRNKTAVLLATQRLEESETQSDRLALLVNGGYRCLGSLEQLKSQYGQRYRLILKLSKEYLHNTEKVKNVIQENLANATLKDHYQGKLQYDLMNTSITIGHLFKFMLDVNKQFELEEYYIDAISMQQMLLGHSA